MTSRRPSWWTSDEWSTPPDVMAELHEEFGIFDLDPCARPETAKAQRFHTREDNGLIQPWKGRVFVNPPYSNITPWVCKAHESVDAHEAELVVVLVPSATDTAWFHEHVLPFSQVRFFQGRVRFYGWQGTPIPAPRTPSMLAIYRDRGK